MRKEKVLIIGALGQIGTELFTALQGIYGEDSVVASDIVEKRNLKAGFQGIYEHLNVLDKENISALLKKYKITQVYNLAAILSAKGEQNPLFAWRLNMEGLLNVLTLIAEDEREILHFWPSSIAAFGPNTPRLNTSQFAIMDPNTAYGISKQAGERWAEYYWHHSKVDTRSLRYPGLISYKAMPGGGTTDYAVDIFHKAILNGTYECFLQADTQLPMMYMPDAVRATLEIMHTEASNVKIRSSYNVASFSFDPNTLSNEIKKHLPNFSITYKPDFRQQIANSWPASIDDSHARNDWSWQNKYNLAAMVTEMLEELNKILIPK
jgi:nucleoside-diphosphate-sugar epimerase